MARPFIWITKGGHDAKSTKRDILYIQYQRGAPLKRGVNVKVGASQGLGGYTLMPLTRLPSRAQSPTGRLATQKIQWGEGRRQAPSSSVLCLSGHVHTHSSKHHSVIKASLVKMSCPGKTPTRTSPYEEAQRHLVLVPEDRPSVHMRLSQLGSVAMENRSHQRKTSLDRSNKEALLGLLYGQRTAVECVRVSE
eukprot:Blabericola_migrator_1__12198@NODE_757_length_6644_cov_306_303026_g505_i1_p3_GENE_NODE_757_length_6644_cov_306_303026_g505_i1NODE_757_length_6644_cov_306_303026_g505_i1_p3_ORF_typecomplete_len193_score20_08_NODE_757_length_6644_cov_306_303026_g505_i134274005